MKYSFNLLFTFTVLTNFSFAQKTDWTFILPDNYKYTVANMVTKTPKGNYFFATYEHLTSNGSEWSNLVIHYNPITEASLIYNIGLEQKTPTYIHALDESNFILFLKNGNIYRGNIVEMNNNLIGNLAFNNNEVELLYANKTNKNLTLTGYQDSSIITFIYDLYNLTLLQSYIQPEQNIPLAVEHLSNFDQIAGFSSTEGSILKSYDISTNTKNWQKQILPETYEITSIVVDDLDNIYISAVENLDNKFLSSVILAFNKDGKKLWTSNLNPIDLESLVHINKIDITPKGDIIGVGFAGKPGLYADLDILVYRLNNEGEVLGRIRYDICTHADIGTNLLLNGDDVVIIGNCDLTDYANTRAYMLSTKDYDINYSSHEINCDDDRCVVVEDYCNCKEDCDCTFGNISLVEYKDNGFFYTDENSNGSVFFCSKFIAGIENENTYLALVGLNFRDCNNENNDINISLSNSSIYGLNINENGTYNIPSSVVQYIELTPADIAAGSITITSSAPDGYGNTCSHILTINYNDFPQANTPYCELDCNAGRIAQHLLTDTLLVCETGFISLCTDGMENLTLPCDDDGTWNYFWRAYVNTYDEWVDVSGWVELGPCPTIPVVELFIDKDGKLPPFTPNKPIEPLDYFTGEPITVLIEAAALCTDTKGNIMEGCLPFKNPLYFVDVNGINRAVIVAKYLPATDAYCNCASEVYDCKGTCDGMVVTGEPCDDGYITTINDTYNTDCECKGEVDYGACENNAGLISIINGGEYGNMDYICAGSCVIVETTDFVLRENQEMTIVWHTDATFTESNFPIENILGYGKRFCNEGNKKQTIYVTAFGSANNVNSWPNFNDECLVYSNTIEVNLLKPVDILVEVSCGDSTSLYSVCFNVSGGITSYFPESNFIVTGDFNSLNVSTYDTLTFGPSSNTVFSLQASDDNGCEINLRSKSDCFPRPTTLPIFFGEASQDGNSLKWIVRPDNNIDYFVIESSIDGINYSTLDTILNNKISGEEYEYIDDGNNNNELTYYKLTGFLNDPKLNCFAKEKEQNVISVDRSDFITSINENLVADLFVGHSYISIPSNKKAVVYIYELTGRLVKSLKFLAGSNNNEIALDFANLSNGLYLLSIKLDEQTITKKILIK